jgi:uncharacterized cupin superfamily protein
MSEATSSLNADGVYEPFEIGRVPWQEFLHGERFGMRYQQLGVFGGGSQISVSMEVLPAGRQANPSHYHLLEEEHVFVLEGSLTLRLGERTFSLQPGHYACFPAGQKVGHALINETDSPCRYLVFGNPQPNDVAVYTDSGRVSVKLTGEGYRQSATMDYWDGIAS